jgi:hypothetical protein
MRHIDPNTEKTLLDEYLRRNMLHASACGAEANTRTALGRLRTQKRPPKWLIETLEGVLARCEKVAPEMARHRDEIEIRYDRHPGQVRSAPVAGWVTR